MTRKTLSRFASSVTMMLALGSCTLDYTVDVSMKGNQVVFRVAQSGWFSRDEEAKVRHVWVRQLSAKEQVVWELKSIDDNGRWLRELGYGSLPSGMTVEANPEPLAIGQVYRVEVSARGGGGSQQFVILPGSGPPQPITVMQH